MRGAQGLAYALLVLFVLGLGCGRGSDARRGSPGGATSPGQPAAQKVYPERFVTEYERDEAAADARYKGKTVEVYGRANVSPRGYVSLQGPEQFKFKNVYCYFGEDGAGRFSGLTPGAMATVRGVVRGKVVELGQTRVELEQCELTWGESSPNKIDGGGRFPGRR